MKKMKTKPKGFKRNHNILARKDVVATIKGHLKLKFFYIEMRHLPVGIKFEAF